MRKFILIFILFIFFISCVDGATKIGLDRLNWSQSLPSGEGIKFSGTAPATTTGKLYSDGGILEFDGTWIASGADSDTIDVRSKDLEKRPPIIT